MSLIKLNSIEQLGEKGLKINDQPCLLDLSMDTRGGYKTIKTRANKSKQEKPSANKSPH